MHSSVAFASAPVTTTPDPVGLIVLGVGAAMLLVALWRPLLRLLLIAVVALVFIGLAVVVGAATSPAGSAPPPAEAPPSAGTGDPRVRAGATG